MSKDNLFQILDNKDTSNVKHAMKLGAYTGIGLILFSIIQYALSLNQNDFQLPGYIVLITGIIIGIKQYRDKVLGGFISYAESLKLGISISFFSAFIISFYTYIFFKYMDPSQMEALLQQVKTQMESQGRTDVEMDLVNPFLEKYMNGIMFVSSIFSYTFMGFLFSLFISFFLKKENLTPLNADSSPQ